MKMGGNQIAERTEGGAFTGSPILLVEDSPDQRFVLTRYLQHVGYSCVAAESLGEARAALGLETFDCALVDVGLPDGRGTELIEYLAREHPYTISIMLTGETDPDTIIKALRAGAFDYLVKPVDLTTVTAAVQRAVGHHKLLKERDELLELLKRERDSLRVAVDEATADVRAYADRCEASNALLHTLLRLSDRTNDFQTEEELFIGTIEEAGKHVPMRCAALVDPARRDLFAALRADDGSIEFVTSKIEWTHDDHPETSRNPASSIQSIVASCLGRGGSSLECVEYPQKFWNSPVSSVALYLDPEFRPNDAQKEFLEMCAHLLSFEWQRFRLLSHAAQNSSLGNIALELSKGFLRGLTAVRAAAGVIGDTVNGGDAAEALRLVEENVELLTNQTKVFNGLAHPGDGTIETVHIDEFIDQTLDLLSSSIQHRGLAIDKRFETRGECVLFNGRSLSRTFLDLVSSAVRTVKLGGTIYISISAADDDHVACELSHVVATHELFDMAAANSDVNWIRMHPSFMLAQRTVRTCGGTLTLDREGASRNTFRIVLPRNSAVISGAV